MAALPLPARGGAALLSREHLWLCRPPHPDIEYHLWNVICVAALGAMEYGRRVLLSISLRPREGEAVGGSAGAAPGAAAAGGTRDGDPLLDGDDASFPLLASPPNPGNDVVPPAEDTRAQALLRAQRAAVAHFYAGLADFCHTTRQALMSLDFRSPEARNNHPLIRVRALPAVPPPPNLAAGTAPAPPPPRLPAGATRCVSSTFAVVLPPSAKLPKRGDLCAMSNSRATSGPSSSEIFKARTLDHNIGDIVLSPAVFRGGVIDNMVFCVCGSWRSALRSAEDNPEHVPCGAG